MLEIKEIEQFIREDAVSERKRFAVEGQRYYEGDHDIRNYTLWYYDENGKLVKDQCRSNIRISHPFFTELVDQAVQYILSGKEGFILSDIPELQKKMDEYFNDNEDFVAELSEVLTGCQAKGFEYMYAYKNEANRLSFQCADSIGVVEIEGRYASDKKDHVLFWYIDRIDAEGKKIKRIMDWDSEQVCFYLQEDNGNIEIDPENKPKPHILYEGQGEMFQDNFGFIPFFRLDNNKKQFSALKSIKGLVDDYDLMACGLSNNLQDASEYLLVVTGFHGDNLDELVTNTKVKKRIGIDEDSNVDIKTVEVPYEARKAKMELDKEGIYQFGMGLNMAGLKDTTATTNIAIKAAYSLLDLKCSKLIIRLQQFLRKIIRVVLEEINAEEGTDYQIGQVYFNFAPEVMSNALENAQIALTEAQEQQTRITTLMNIATQIDHETLIQNLCDALDIDYEEIKGKLPNPNEAQDAIKEAQGALNGVADE